MSFDPAPYRASSIREFMTAAEKESIPYRRLFAAVILRAITDYVNPDVVLLSAQVGGTKDDAYKFLTTDERIGPFLDLLDLDTDTFCEGVRVGDTEAIRRRLVRRSSKES